MFKFFRKAKKPVLQQTDCSTSLPPDFLPVLIENMQAQIAGYYNVDTTDEERKVRNAVIEEYRDLISIYKHKMGRQ